MSSVTDFFSQYLDQGLQQQLKKAVESAETGNLLVALDAILEDRGTSPSAIPILRVVKALYHFTGHDVDACGWILSHISKDEPTKGEQPSTQASPMDQKLAMILFPQSLLNDKLSQDAKKKSLRAHQVTEEILDKVRTEFFSAEPLLAMVALLKAESFDVPAQIVTLAILIIDAMIRDHVEIGSRELILSLREKHSPASPTDEEITTAVDLVKTIKALAYLVKNAAHVPQLYKASFRSARQISLTKKGTFSTQMVKEGMEEKNAFQIHDFAERIECRNEHLWLSLMQSRMSDFVPITPHNVSDRGTKDRGDSVSQRNLTDIFRLEDTACETCCSVTSLSAYFADLLALMRDTSTGIKKSASTGDAGDTLLLKGTSHNKTAEGGQSGTELATNKADDAPEKVSLLNLLSKRRPDLQNLELSCANAQTLVPYIDLINEVLESYIHFKANPPLASTKPKQNSIVAYNTPSTEYTSNGDEHAQEAVYNSGNTDYEVYTDIIAKQMFPFTVFPYNQPRDAIMQFFQSFQLPTTDLIEAFSSPELIIQKLLGQANASATPQYPVKVEKKMETRLLRGASETLRRHYAAEFLGLQQADFTAITGETFFPAWFAEALVEVPGAAKIETGCPWTAATLWGYSDDATMTDRTEGDGLSFIKRKLMARSGLGFEDILDLVKSQFFCQDLVITNANGSRMFKSSIENLRLLCSATSPPFKDLTPKICFKLQSFMRLKAKLKWSTKDLDATIFCLRTRELETSATLGEMEQDDLFSISPYVIKGIADILRLSKICGVETSALLPLWGLIDTFGPKSLFHVKFLTRSLAQIDPIFSPPLSGPDVDFEKALVDEAFEENDEDNKYEYLRDNGKVSSIESHITGICLSLKWPVEYFPALLEVTGLTEAKLNLETFTILYRHVIICRILRIPEKDCVAFFDLFYRSDEDPLGSPKNTLVAVKKWKTIFESGWDLEMLTKVLPATGQDASNQTINGLDEMALNMTLAIREGAKELRKSLAFLFAGGVATQKSVVDCAAHLFDAETAKVVAEFIQGIQTQSETVVLADMTELESLMKESKEWPVRISVVPDISSNKVQAELVLAGVLTPKDRKWVLEANTKHLGIQETLKKLVDKSLLALKIIEARFTGADEGNRKLLSGPLSAHWTALLELLGETKTATEPEGQVTVLEQIPESTQDSAENPSPKEPKVLPKPDPNIQIEMEDRERRGAFAKLSAPVIIEEQLQTLIMNTVKDLIAPNLDPALLSVLLTDVVQIKTQEADVESRRSAMAILQELGELSGTPIVETSLDVYFTPSRTDIFTLHYQESEETPSTKRITATTEDTVKELKINGLSMPFNKGTKSWTAIRMAGGQPYRLQAEFAPSSLLWSTPKSVPARFDENMLLPAKKTELASTISRLITRIVAVCQRFNLAAEEVEYLNKGSVSTTSLLGVKKANEDESARVFGVDLNSPKLDDLIRLRQYRSLRDRSNARGKSIQDDNVGSTKSRIIDFFLRISGITSIEKSNLATIFADTMGWNKLRIEAAIEKILPSNNGNEVIIAKELSRFDLIYGLYTAMTFDERLGRVAGESSCPEISTLFDLAQPRHTLSASAIAEDLHVSKMLQARLSPGQRAAADAKLRENQRQAIVAYLLQQSYITEDLKIFDADGLFEYFLIDVQMGPQLRTSRIKQGVSVIQLFAQRCLLGLEKDVVRGAIPREKWDWMQQYSIWEAYRKMFLYPENWIDPTLRDDKSQLFEQFESSLMQKDLSINTFLHSIQTYIYSLNEIASLDIVAYLHEIRGESDQVFHFFGRTRASPHSFYYRTVSTRLPDHDEIFWRPWSKIDIDISSVESDWQGGRLKENGVYLVPVMIGGRLYLFMPQIIPKSQKKDPVDQVPPPEDQPAEKDPKLSSLANASIADHTTQQTWEVTMSWTEFVRNSWTPKRVSPGSIVIKKDLPTVTQFLFDPTIKKESQLTVLVSYTTSNSVTIQKAGAFVFSDGQITIDENPGLTPWTRPFPSYFHKVPAVETDSDKSKLKTALEAYGANPKPLMWIPEDLKEHASALRWTLSFTSTPQTSQKVENGDNTLAGKSNSFEKPNKDVPLQKWIGLVLSKKDSSGSRASYFALPREDVIRKSWNDTSLKGSMDLVRLDHTFSNELMQAAADRIDPVRRVYDMLAAQDPRVVKENFGLGSYVWLHELSQPSAIYTWELGLHAILLAVDRFFATQQFEEALQLARLVFDPTIDVEAVATASAIKNKQPSSEDKDPDAASAVIDELNSKAAAQSCWRFPPFAELAQDMADKGTDPIDLSQLTEEVRLAIIERRSHGGLVHATARGRPQAYMKWIVMKYAEILIASGDVHFRRGTLESLPLATQRYIEAAHVLGPEPPKIPQLGNRKAKPMTFAKLSSEEDDFDSKVGKELGWKKGDTTFTLDLPFSAELENNKKDKGSADKTDNDFKRENILCFLRTPYFCVPLNPKFKQMRSLVHERLFNVRNSRDIQGRPVIYALLEPPIDPGAFISLRKQGVNVSDALAMVMGDLDSPLPRHRFEVLLARALDLCGELRSLADRLMLAVEKKEQESFSLLRAQHQTVIQKMMLQIKQINLEEAQQTIQSLVLNRESQESQLAFYLGLVGEGMSKIPSPTEPWTDIEQNIEEPTRDDLRMSSHEKTEMNMATAAGLLNLVASGIDGLVAPFCMMPQIQSYAAPLGVGASVSVGGSNVTSMMQAGSAAIKMAAMVVAEEGSRAGRKAQLTRQLQERRLQANIRGREIKSIDKQIEVQQIRVKAMSKEIEVQESEIEETTQVEQWYRTKYTNEQLYGWMEKSLRSVYFQAYTLTMGAARRAESSLSFERGSKISIMRPGGYWDASRDGLHAADHLYLDLKRLEAAHLEERSHDFEIVKTVSLRQIDPQALLRLRLSGSTDVALGEILYDMDFPGHYMRRIRSVSVSIPALLGPYAGVNATLTLLEHKYRVSSSASTAAEYDPSTPENRDAFRTDRIPITSVAISSGSQDSGVFELNFGGPRYMPFEGAGAVSTWRLELPTEIRRFDYETISDVLIHVQYTALDGGPCLRAAANESVRNATKVANTEGRQSGFWAMWDLKHDFSTEWYGFASKLRQSSGESSGVGTENKATMKLQNLRDRLPFWTRYEADADMKSILLLSKDLALVADLNMEAAVGDGNWETETFANTHLKKSKSLKTTELAELEISASRGLLSGKKDIENVYFMVHYLLKDKEAAS